ncbi:hypothetical protein HanIR_Chr11g0523021 [Helianthus annuus]|nr:hypothetical protein HanIR_Chr11g0523021 [Helianthus annuus]
MFLSLHKKKTLNPSLCTQMSHHKFYLYAHNKDSPAKIHSVSLVYSSAGTLTPSLLFLLR